QGRAFTVIHITFWWMRGAVWRNNFCLARASQLYQIPYLLLPECSELSAAGKAMYANLQSEKDKSWISLQSLHSQPMALPGSGLTPQPCWQLPAPVLW